MPFTNWQAFSGLGYSIKTVVDGDLANYSLSQTYVIDTPKAAHPWGSWLIYKGTVYYSTEQGLVGVPSEEIFAANGGDFKYRSELFGGPFIFTALSVKHPQI